MSADAVIKLFREFDVDGNGLVYKKELADVLVDLKPGFWSSERLDLLLQEADTNHDGAIDYTEFIAWVFKTDPLPKAFRKTVNLPLSKKALEKKRVADPAADEEHVARHSSREDGAAGNESSAMGTERVRPKSSARKSSPSAAPRREGPRIEERSADDDLLARLREEGLVCDSLDAEPKLQDPDSAPRRSDAPGRRRHTEAAATPDVPKTRAKGDWFTELFGFKELNYEFTQDQLSVCDHAGGRMLLIGPNGNRYKVGRFSTPSLAELEDMVSRKGGMSALPGRLSVGNITGDVAALHGDPLNRHATFQVASQFNCLEFVHEEVTPERGITCYVRDKTQGPACSIACGPATAYRNYFASVKGEVGQRRDRQINNLHDINALLRNERGRFFRVANGYTKAEDEGLTALNRELKGMSGKQKQALREALRIGVHEDVQVTSSEWGTWTHHDEKQLVTQVFGSACSVSYSGNGAELWAPFASLVLSASYEATLYAALLSAIRYRGKQGSNRVFLTSLGGGVFGNAEDWIVAAMRQAFRKFANAGLEVYIVSFRPPVSPKFEAFADLYTGM